MSFYYCKVAAVRVVGHRNTQSLRIGRSEISVASSISSSSMPFTLRHFVDTSIRCHGCIERHIAAAMLNIDFMMPPMLMIRHT